MDVKHLCFLARWTRSVPTVVLRWSIPLVHWRWRRWRIPLVHRRWWWRCTPLVSWWRWWWCLIVPTTWPSGRQLACANYKHSQQYKFIHCNCMCWIDLLVFCCLINVLLNYEESPMNKTRAFIAFFLFSLSQLFVDKLPCK